MTVKKYTVNELAELTEQAKNGSDEAKAEIYEALKPSMQKHAFRNLHGYYRTVENAEDICEEALTQNVFQNLNQLKNNNCLISWIEKVIDNECQRMNTGMSDYAVVYSPDETQEDQEGIALMMECLDSIRPQYAQILRMHYLDDLSYDEITKKTGMKKTTLIGRIQTARKELRREMEWKGYAMV